MSLRSRSRSWTQMIFRRTRAESEMDAELRAHMEAYAEDMVRSGMARDEAMRRARIEFGGLERVKEECREARGIHFVESLLQDLRFALRMLRKSPGFTAVAILTLALGIGANTAIFSIFDAVLLRPLPYASPSRLVSVQEAGRQIGNPASYPDFFDWQSKNRVFSSMASYHGAEFTLTGAGEPIHVQALIASAGLFEVLEARPLIGRIFNAQDDERGHDVAVLSHSLWRERFHSSPDIVGRSLMLDNERFTIIGVMPAGFQFPPNFHKDLWLSIAVDRESRSNIMTGRGYNVLNVIARLKTRVSLANAQANMDLVARQLAHEYPETNAKRTTVRLLPESERIVGSVRLPMLLMLGAVTGVLLIACANLANLSLARNLLRQKEVAVRAALGAPRWRVLRQLLTESLLLSMLGGAAGITLGFWGTEELVRFAPQDLPRISQAGMDWRVLVFALLLCLTTGILFGSVPAFRGSKANLAHSLNETSRTASQGTLHLRLGGVLIVAETSLAMMLLIGAGLLISSYMRLVHAPLGFNPAGLLTFNFDLPSPPYTTPRTVSFMSELLPRLRALPGVTVAAADWSLPISGSGVGTGLDFEGRRFAPGNVPFSAMDAVTPGYFRALGIPLLKGRSFTDADNASSLPVVMINEAFAHHYFPDKNPLGQRIKPSFSMTNDFPWRQIIGVVGNTKLGGVAEDFEPEFYMPFSQVPNFSAVILKVQGDPLRLSSAVRSVIGSMDQNIPIYDVETMDGYLSSSIATKRFLTLLLALFAFLALALAAVGVYGVVSFGVGQRTHEIGIRMALGAQRGDVMRLIMGQGAKLAFFGAGAGILAALGLTRLIASLLFGVSATDPLTFVVVAALLVSIALLACYIPARRAMRVDPMVALRYE